MDARCPAGSSLPRYRRDGESIEGQKASATTLPAAELNAGRRSSPQIPSFSGGPCGQLDAGAGGDSPLQHQPSTHSLPRIDATSRQELRTNFQHVAEEPHFVIATRLVARREMFRRPSIPFGNDNLPRGIVMARGHRFCSASSTHAPPLNLNRSRIGACGVAAKAIPHSSGAVKFTAIRRSQVRRRLCRGREQTEESRHRRRLAR
jgi:hypothetical protein